MPSQKQVDASMTTFSGGRPVWFWCNEEVEVSLVEVGTEVCRGKALADVPCAETKGRVWFVIIGWFGEAGERHDWVKV